MPKKPRWTDEEDKIIADEIGEVSLYEISKKVNKTPDAIKSRWKRCRKSSKGYGSLRHRERKLVWCDKCSSFRTKVTRQGCKVCIAKEVLQSKRDEEAALYASLPQDSKERKKPQTHGSYRSRRPKAPDTRGMDAYSKRKALEAYDMALEHWEVENLRRETKALQKRVERYRKEL